MYITNRGKNYSNNQKGRPYHRRGSSAVRVKRGFRAFNPSDMVRAFDKSASNEVVAVTHSFEDFGLGKELLQNIASKKYVTPTPIQDRVIPLVLAGRDVIGIANTGTGKTAAFLIPLIKKIFNNRAERVLIISPTRELANQISSEIISLSRGMGIRVVSCIGGTSIRQQKNDLRGAYNFVVGTPGRINDMAKSNHLDLSVMQTVVLDEADHMVDIGFIHDIRLIISLLSPVRQSLFFSATIDGEVKNIIGTFVKNPATVSVKTKEVLSYIKQEIVKVNSGKNKIDQLHEILIREEFKKVLIFGRTKYGVQKLSDELVRRGFRADAIHGNKRQSQRTRTLDRFRRNDIKILLATDVASRGLDISNVSHVINYDLPESRDAYIHRIGRTGRANKTGVALTFVD